MVAHSPMNLKRKGAPEAELTRSASMLPNRLQAPTPSVNTFKQIIEKWWGGGHQAYVLIVPSAFQATAMAVL